MHNRRYLSPAEAAEKGWYSRAVLKRKFRRRIAAGQKPAGKAWQGRGAFDVYDLADCMPLRPYRAPSPLQRFALSMGRALRGTRACVSPGCAERFAVEAWREPFCPACDLAAAQSLCRETARGWIAAGAVVLDVETTGLGDDAEVIEVSVSDLDGNIILESLVRPTRPIPAEATAIHGITDEDVANAPTWAEVHDDFCLVTAGVPVVIYNANYDVRVLAQTAAVVGLPSFELDARCAMLLYANWYGERKENGRLRWQKLAVAAEQCGFAMDLAHRAAADCQATAAIVRYMAGES